MQYNLKTWDELKTLAREGDEQAIEQLIETIEELGQDGNVIDLENAEWEL